MICLRYLARYGRVEVVHWEIRDGWFGRGPEAEVHVRAHSRVPCWLVARVARAHLEGLQRRWEAPPRAFRLTEWAAERAPRRDFTGWRLTFAAELQNVNGRPAAITDRRGSARRGEANRTAQ